MALYGIERNSPLRRFFSSYWTIGVIWALVALFVVLGKYHGDPMRLNNFLIYRQTFYHTLEQVNLYAYYPEEYFDHNLYGPLFAVIMAPFALLPHLAGAIAWELFLAGVMFLTILRFPFGKERNILIMWYVSNEIVSTLLMTQFNMVIAALLPATYLALQRDKEWLAALFILIGAFTKIYGIVGLALFFFARRKWNMTMWLGIWSVVLFCLPMLLSSPSYILDQYKEWYLCITDKNSINTTAASVIDLSFHQNVSFLGMAHRISGMEFSDLYILVPAAILFCLPYVRVREYRYDGFRWGFVASALMCLVLFSTSTESSGYIMALLGVAIWYWSAPWKRGGWSLFLLLFALVLGSFGHSDLMPRYLRQEFIRPYVLKSLPITMVWLQQIYELLRKDYSGEGERKQEIAG